MDVSQEQVEEPLVLLADDGPVALPRVFDRGKSGIRAAHPTEEGFESYLNSYFDGYEDLSRTVDYELANYGGATALGSDVLAERLDAPVAVVRHILRMFARNNYATIHEADESRIFMIQVKPRLRHWLEGAFIGPRVQRKTLRRRWRSP
jgi:hypothetical protein